MNYLCIHVLINDNYKYYISRMFNSHTEILIQYL